MAEQYHELDVSSDGISLLPIKGIPEIKKGDDLSTIITAAAKKSGVALRNNDVLVMAHKIVSKSQGLSVKKSTVKVSARARNLAKKICKDPQKVEVILRETRKIIVAKKMKGRDEGVLICENKNGHTSANAGVDESNTGDEDRLILIPRRPDAAAKKLRDQIVKKTKKSIGIVITDTFGRPWRMGLVNVALGVAGIPAILDVRGIEDSDGRILNASLLAIADELAAASGILMGKTAGVPVVIVRGLKFTGKPGKAKELVRPTKEDLFK
ncbi:MAG: coenzyme F420-0:L-glutamate ligase [Candidatus Lindowbacteria bacterium]|nr:coenzyme F420-0:L-glutamate ligase [Candidatus Lindowbacteria bacterium]